MSDDRRAGRPALIALAPVSASIAVPVAASVAVPDLVSVAVPDLASVTPPLSASVAPPAMLPVEDARSSGSPVGRRARHGWLAAVALAALALSGCATGQPRGTAGGPGAAGLGRLIPGLGPTETPTTAPTPTITPTATASPTPTVAPHPLAIDVMRGGHYPGSDLAIEQTLAPGTNYDRYVVSYDSEGLNIDALLTEPRGERPPTGWPAIVFNHGYIPPREYRTTERYIAYVDAFARSGYVVIKPDYRGHGDSEGEAAGGYGSPAYTTDVLNALASVRRRPGVDPARVGMWGHSMGGHITLRSMVVTDTVKAGVIWAGVVASYPDLFQRWRRPSTLAAAQALTPGANATPAAADAAQPGGPAGPAGATPPSRRWRDDLVARFGGPEVNPAFWAGISANTFVADLSGPLQLHHGTADKSVPLSFSESLEQEVRAVGGPVELYVYDGDDHNLSRNLTTALARSVAFFDAHVKGGG